LLLTALVVIAPAAEARTIQIAVTVRALPRGQLSSLELVGPHVRRHLRTTGTLRVRVPHAGRYRLLVRRIHVRRTSGAVKSGAIGYPNRSTINFTVKRHGTARVEARYSIVNPRVRRAPRSLKVVGDPMAPAALVLPRGPEVPPVGSVLTSGPTADLPAGLVARVTSITQNGNQVQAALAPASVSDAVPLLSYGGHLRLAPAPGAQDDVSGDGTVSSPRALRGASSPCAAPKLLSFGAHLDSVELWDAFLGAWPPQMRLTLAVRTTEHLGLALAAAGINCDFELGEAGPFQGAIAVGPVVIPVFASFPVKAGIHLNGTLNAARVNIASTTVAHVAGGLNENSAFLHEEGSNVWLSGTLSLSGSAKLSASIGVKAGIGIAKAANVNVEADFGPVFNWKSGALCTIGVNFGSLRGGITAFGKNLHSPSFTPFKKELWSGCSTNGSGLGGGGGPAGPGGGGGPAGPSGGSGGGPSGGPGPGMPDAGPITGPPSLTASDDGGSLAAQVANFSLGATHYFCHAGNAPDYPTGGTITAQGQLIVIKHAQSFTGLCPGRSNAWIGLQGTDGHDYYSNQVDLQQPATPGASVSASNNSGQMFVQLSGFPRGTTYYFCHSGTPTDYPTGGTIISHGQINVTAPNQSFNGGLCSGRSNAWIGLQATDNHDYYSNQVDLQQPATPGASISASNNNGQMIVQFTGFPQGTTYYFCHSGNPSDYPTGGVITAHGQITISSPNQSFASGLCSGRGNAWIGIQASDNHDYYSNQVDLYAPATPGASIAVFGSSGQMSLQVSGFPTGTTYYFCHGGDPSQYPTGGSIIGRGQINVSHLNQAFGPLCSGSGNAWIGIQATDGHDYYSNQITL
jgi:hypothetical protein